MAENQTTKLASASTQEMSMLIFNATYQSAPTVEEVTHKLSRATVFSKLVAKNSYLSIVLDEPASMLTPFILPTLNQRYKFNRLPFGINVSQDLFQEDLWSPWCH